MKLSQGVQTESKSENRKSRRKAIIYTTESTTYLGCPQLQCTHAGNLALGNTVPLQKQATATAIRSRNVGGPPMDAVARPTLTPRDPSFYHTENELPISFSRASSSTFLKTRSLRLERRKTMARERRGWCCGSPAGCLWRGLCGSVAVLAVGWMLRTAVLM